MKMWGMAGMAFALVAGAARGADYQTLRHLEAPPAVVVRPLESGEVLRSDVRRDVALIKVDPRGRAPLPLRTAAPEAGETVFAIGMPLEKDFQNTLTKGVVSAVRMHEGQRFIQSDVAVDHGNSGGPLLDENGQVVGIADWGYAPDGVSHNLNFFIPIDDALRILALSPAAEGQVAAAAREPRSAHAHHD